MYGLTARSEPSTQLKDITLTEDGKKFLVWLEDLTVILGGMLLLPTLSILFLGLAG